jgi:predicted GNAT family acetyltransferase
LLAIDGPPAITPEPRVRPVSIDQLETLLPAAVAMFTEEVGVSPLRVDGGAGYRARVAELVRAGQSLAWIEGDEVLFKAEIGAVSRAACQVQGVWVTPRLRGQGLGTAGTAAVVEYARASIAPVVSLYVNDYNVAARAAYQRVGFRDVGQYASVLF